MKKKVFTALLVLTIAILFTGCDKKKNESKPEDVQSDWKLSMNNKALNIPDEAKEAFNRATEEYTGMEFEPIALLGTQVVAGTNYMFLCKGTTVTAQPVDSYQIVTIYNSLEDEASVKEVRDFDITKYISKDIDAKNEQLSGGWTVYGKTESAKFDETVKKAYQKALNGYVGFDYSPIAVLGTQESTNTNYAILVLGKSATAEVYYTINVLTIEVSEEGNAKLLNNAYVDLADFN